MEAVKKYSRNELYRLSGSLEPYATWILREKTIHAKRVGEGTTKVQDFDEYLQKRYSYKMATGEINADGSLKEFLAPVLNKGKELAGEKLKSTVEDKLADKKDTEKELAELNKPVEKRILGLKPIVFYSITGLIVLGIGTGIYFIFQTKKKKG